MTVTELRTQLERKKGRLEQIQDATEAAALDLKHRLKQRKRLHEAQMIIQTVAKATQQELEYHVSELVSLALEAVFPNPYKMHLDFELRRKGSEADLTFSKGDSDERIHPLSASGGGALDVASFALRIALWSLQRPRTRATLLLDEPFRFLSRGLQEKASEMLKEISERLGLQMIIVTHERTLIECADRVFEIKQKKRISKVEVVR